MQEDSKSYSREERLVEGIRCRRRLRRRRMSTTAIVRTRSRSTGAPDGLPWCWNIGVILRWEGAVAQGRLSGAVWVRSIVTRCASEVASSAHAMPGDAALLTRVPAHRLELEGAKGASVRVRGGASGLGCPHATR